MALFELSLLGGPWGRRLAGRRAALDALPWAQLAEISPEGREAARYVWTQSAFSEVASAAAFAEIAGALLAAGAPVDLVAAAGDFVVDEVMHAELSARIAVALGGAVALDVDMERLVRPPVGDGALRRAAELVVRTSCVGESLTVGVLKATKAAGGCALVREAVGLILRDEAAHAELGWWFLDWADGRLSDDDRRHLGAIAGEAVRDFSSCFESCTAVAGGGALSCLTYDPAFEQALTNRVVAPLAERGILIAREDLEALAA